LRGRVYGSAIASRVQRLRLRIGLSHTGSAEVCSVCSVLDWFCDFACLGGRGCGESKVLVMESARGRGRGRGRDGAWILDRGNLIRLLGLEKKEEGENFFI